VMAFGLILGFFNYLSGGKYNRLLMFDTALFDFVIIPAIIFESGYSLKKKGLFKNVISIAMFAVVGTLISTLFVGFSLFLFAKFAGIQSIDTTNPAEALVFGALISATDPVATLALLGDVFKVKESTDVPLIYNLIFGESVVNDAVSIVLFRILLKFVDQPKFTAGSFFAIIGSFIYVNIGSVIIGVAVGLFAAMFFKFVSFKYNTAVEIILLAMMALSSYLLAEAAQLSGIMSLFACGIVCGRFAWYNLSAYSRLTSPQTFKVLATAADSYVFLFLGISAFSFPDRSSWRVGFIGIGILLILVGRALNIIPITLITNIWRKRKINWRECIFQWFSGLRGAIAFALSLHCLELDTPNAKAIVTTTLFIVLFSVWVFGGLTLPLLKLLKLDKSTEVKEKDQSNAHLPGAILVINKASVKAENIDDPGDEVLISSDSTKKKKSDFMRRIDEKILRPLLRKRHDQTSPHLRDLLLGGSIPSTLKIEEIERIEYEALYSSMKPAQRISVRDLFTNFYNNTDAGSEYGVLDNDTVDLMSSVEESAQLQENETLSLYQQGESTENPYYSSV